MAFLKKLTHELKFPPVSEATHEGIVAYGGDLSVKRLLTAYQQGIFPWFSNDEPILWWSPPQRAIILLSDFHISRSLKKALKKENFIINFDSKFLDVINACSKVPRVGQSGTWIVDEMIEAYQALHQAGFAHSVEVYKDDKIVGGLYGVSIGGAFFGESMFSLVSNASKVALVALAEQVKAWNFDFIDCQVHSDHLSQFGAQSVARNEFIALLQQSWIKPTRKGKWPSEKETDLISLEQIEKIYYK